MSEKQPLKVVAGTPDSPLIIGDIEIPCYVLEDGTRVLSRGGILKAIGRVGKAKGGRQYDKEFRTPVFLTANNLKPFIPEGLLENSTQIVFRRGAQNLIGYRAEFLPKVCEVFLDARDAGKLHPNQVHIAEACKILHRAFATVGIIALVDEVTGYQEIRDRKALQDILDKYLLAERAKWAKRFPDSFYKEIFRLRGWQWQGMKVNRPQVVGHYTNDIIWDRLAPGVRAELEEINPKDSSGKRVAKHHQWLTEDIGHTALQQHLIGVTVLMNSVVESTPPDRSWNEFKRRLQRVFPKVNTNLELFD